MDKDKSKKSNTIFSRLIIVFIGLVALVMILSFFYGDNGFFEIMETREKIKRLEDKVVSLEKEKELLVEEIKQLKDNPLALERKARERLWLMKKNEKVVVIVKDKDKKKEKTESN